MVFHEKDACISSFRKHDVRVWLLNYYLGCFAIPLVYGVMLCVFNVYFCFDSF